MHVSCYNNTDGQTIAKKLSKNISKETNKLRVCLKEYNATSMQVDPKCPMLMLSDILSPTCNFWMPTSHTDSSISTRVSTTTRRDIIEAFLLLKRCKKELILLKSDMSNVISYWELRERNIKASLELFRDEAGLDVLYHRGCVCMLKKQLLDIQLTLAQCTSSFSGVLSPMVDCPDHDFDLESDSSDCSDSSDDSSDVDSDSS